MEKPKLSFEDFLINYHADNCEGVLDDDMPDAFDSFLENLDTDDLMKFAQKYGNIVHHEGVLKGLDRANEIIKGMK